MFPAHLQHRFYANFLIAYSEQIIFKLKIEFYRVVVKWIKLDSQILVHNFYETPKLQRSLFRCDLICCNLRNSSNVIEINYTLYRGFNFTFDKSDNLITTPCN